jgi:hypothetical protein
MEEETVERGSRELNDQFHLGLDAHGSRQLCQPKAYADA